MLSHLVSCALPGCCYKFDLQTKTPYEVTTIKEVVIMTFGEKLKEARKESGLSQEQFAEKMNVSRSAVAKWETDKGMPDVNNLKIMAQLLNVSVDYLLDEMKRLVLMRLRKQLISMNMKSLVNAEIKGMRFV